MKSQREEYDVFIYVEDDVLIKKEALEYWLHYKDKAASHNYNLGFLRVEVSRDGNQFLIDSTRRKKGWDLLHYTIENETYMLIDQKFFKSMAYSAMWIMDKQAFYNYSESRYAQAKAKM